MENRNTLTKSIMVYAMVLMTFLMVNETLAQSVTSFTLVDAESDTSLFLLNDGDEINFQELPTSNLNVVANTTGTIGSVSFFLNGNLFSTENVTPYALAGDTGGDFKIYTPPLGTTQLLAVAYASSGGNGAVLDSSSITITFVDEPVEVLVTGVNFINCPMIDLMVGDTIDLDVEILPANATNKNIAFTASDGTSVGFLSGKFIASVSGQITVTATSFSDGGVFDQCVINIAEPITPIDPYDTVQAIDFDDQNGIQLAAGGTVVGYINNNDYISFENVAFGRGPSFGSLRGSSDRVGGTVEFRTDSVDGPLLASATITNTGGWTDYQNFPITVPNASSYEDGTLFLGTKTLFLVFKGGSGFLFDVDEFSFNPSDVVIEDLSFINCPTEPINVGDTIDLDVLITPGNTTNQTIAFTASDGLSVDFLSGEFIASEPGEITVTATSFSDGSVFDQCAITISDTIPAPLPAIIRINAGGPSISYGDSTFITDDFFAGNGKSYVNNSITNILGTSQDDIYKTERSTNANLQSFSYDIPVTNGEYSINLHFAEIYFGATGGGAGGVGKRVFDVTVEGQPVLIDFDINAEVSPMTALIETYSTIVTDEELNLTFSATVNQPKVSAIEVYGEGSLIIEPDTCVWNTLANSSLSKVEAQSVKVNDKLYVLAGFLSGLQITAATEIYDPMTDAWSLGAPMPTAVTHMGAVAVGDEIWILAGFVGNHPGVATDQVQIYNTVTDTWSAGPSLPNPRGSGAAAFSDGKIHFFGGLLPDRMTDVGEHYILNVNDQATGWQVAADMPEPRNHLSGAAVNGKIYAVGGQFGHDGGTQDQSFLHTYNPTTNTWTQLTDLPTPRSHFEPGTIVHNDKIIIVGGRNGNFFFDDVSEYDPATDTWTERCELPTNLLAPSAKVFGDQLIVANGGEDGVCCPKSETISIGIEPEVISSDPLVSGELKKWHKVTLSFEGPELNEASVKNPFADYRLNVTFANGSKSYTVPGFYAADGDAANSSASSGNIWQAHFSPDETGTWTYTTSFREGTDIAISTSPTQGIPTSFDGQTGTFDIAPSDKTGRDFRSTGRLEYVGEHYMQFAETGEYFFKVGADAPENTFAYEDFDATPNKSGRRKSWSLHAADFDLNDAGDYTWGAIQGDSARADGRELLGVVNYLANEGMNVFSFLTFSLDGDDDNVYPHLQLVNDALSYDDVYHDRFDVSKLAQWERILEYADKKGMYMHFKTQETENDQKMDGGQLGRERKLYYRELISRFGHHLALNWNLGEENDIWQELSDPNNDIVKSYAQYIQELDPYDHNIVIHTYPGQQDEVYDELVGPQSVLTGASVQTGIGNVHNDVKRWVLDSRNAGKKWVVANDEQGGAQSGVTVDASYPDSQLPEPRNNSDNRVAVRNQVLWGTMLAGGAGVEYYYGYQTGCDDLDCQDHRTRQSKWEDAKIALDFFNTYLQSSVIEMISNDELTTDNGDYVFAKEGEIYAIYLPSGGSATLNLSSQTGSYEVKWYDPRNGGALQDGSLTSISGGGSVSIGLPPSDPSSDWVALVTVQDEAPLRVLVYHETAGFRHGSINAGIQMVQDFGTTNGWTVEASQSSDIFNDANLSTVDVVIWMNTSGNGLLTATEQDAFENYIQSGGGFVGVHAATDTYRNGSWPWYNELVGAIVQTGPNHTSNNFNATMDVIGSHPAVSHLGVEWNKSEEYYYWELNGGFLFSGNIDLLRVRSTGSQTYDVARPITWYKEYDGGRSFYTALGHNGGDYSSNSDFITMMEQAILWAGGEIDITSARIGHVAEDILATQNELDGFSFYPNPVENQLVVLFEDKNGGQLKLLDLNGKILHEMDVETAKATLDISALKKGLYLLEVSQDGFLKKVKIFKD
ncbi:ThuA domain-containing protein [Ekhidna sp.]